MNGAARRDSGQRKSKSVLNVVRQNLSRRKYRDFSEENGYLSENRSYEGTLNLQEKAKEQKRLELFKEAQTIQVICEAAKQRIDNTHIFDHEKEERQECDYYNLFDLRIIKKGAIKTTILEDTINDFYSTMRHIKYAYQGAIQHKNEQPLDVIAQLINATAFPHITTKRRAFEAIYIINELYEETIEDPYWNKKEVNELEAALIAGSMYYASLLDGRTPEQATINVMSALEDEYGKAIDQRTATTYINQTVYKRFRPPEERQLNQRT